MSQWHHSYFQMDIQGYYEAHDRSFGVPFAYLKSNSTTHGWTGMAWKDPILDIINAVRELSFRAAVAISNPLNPSEYQVVNGSSTDFAAIILFAAFNLTTLPLFLGWCNANVDEMLKKIGSHPIQYAFYFQILPVVSDVQGATAVN